MYSYTIGLGPPKALLCGRNSVVWRQDLAKKFCPHIGILKTETKPKSGKIDLRIQAEATGAGAHQ